MKLVGLIFTVLAAAFFSCTDNTGNKGTLIISLTDSPADADDVKSVNLFITNVEALRGGDWKSLRYFDQPVGINLLEYTGGKSLPLLDQFLDPGSFSQLKLSLNLADPGSSLIRNPQCNVGQVDGSTKAIYFYQAGTIDIIVDHGFDVATRGHTDITLDIDVRKSLLVDDHGNYILKPVVRLIETAKAGHIASTVLHHNSGDRIVVFAYHAGQYASSETSAPAAGQVRFANAVTSARMSLTTFGLGFLEAGNYDLIFAKHSATGEFLEVLGRQNGVAVASGETLALETDLNTLSGS